MSYQREAEMYPAVKQWLHDYLQVRYPRHSVITVVCHAQRLNSLIRRLEIDNLLPKDWQSWDVQVDVVGFVCSSQDAAIALIECKNRPISLSHLSQIIGYCRVVKPQIGMILSSEGISEGLQQLLITFGRQDVLIYAERHQHAPQRIILARWNAQMNSPEPSSAIPSGSLG